MWRTKASTQAIIAIGSGALLLALPFVYCRYVLLAPRGYLPGQAAYSDFYFNFYVWREQLSMIEAGFVPLGTFWIHTFYGGFSASTLPYNGWSDLPNSISMFVWALIGDPIVTLRFLIPAILLVSLLSSYAYGYVITARKDASLLFAMAYAFNVQPFSDIYYGHLNLFAAYSLIPLILLSWEWNIAKWTLRRSLLAASALVVLFFTEWQVLYFVTFGLVLRVLFELYGNRTRKDRFVGILKSSAFSFILFLVVIIPFFVHFLFARTRELGGEALLGVNVYDYFVRPLPLPNLLQNPVPMRPSGIFYQYVGLSVLALMLFPILVGHARWRSSKLYRYYVMHMILCLFFLLFSGPDSAPFSPSVFIAYLLPFLSGIRVVGRSSTFVYLSSSLCASIGYVQLTASLSRLSWRWFLLRPRLARLLGIWRKGLPLLLSLLIFLDLTYGLEPKATQSYIPSSASHDFIRQQSGDFRLVELPQFWGLATLTEGYTKHEVIDYRPQLLRNESKFLRIYNDLGQLPELLYVRSGDLAQHLGAEWLVSHSETCLFHTSRSDFLSPRNKSSLMIDVVAHNPDDHLQLYQDLTAHPPLTNSTYLNVSLLIQSCENATVDIVVLLKEMRSDLTSQVVYRLGDPSKSSTSYGKENVIYIRDRRGNWTGIMRNISEDLLDSKIGEGRWLLQGLRLIIRNSRADSIENHIKVFLDFVSIFNYTPVAVKCAILGVRYVLVHTDPAFFSAWNMTLTLDSQSALSILFYLQTIGDFREVCFDGDILVLENMRYHGFAFAVKDQSPRVSLARLSLADATVSCRWEDRNTIELRVEAKESCLVLVSQNFDEGWVARGSKGEIALLSLLGITGFYIKPGNHHIRLYFTYYRESLILLLAFFVTLIFPVGSAIFWEQRRFRMKLTTTSFLWGASIAFSSFLLTGTGVSDSLPRFTPYMGIIFWLGSIVATLSVVVLILVKLGTDRSWLTIVRSLNRLAGILCDKVFNVFGRDIVKRTVIPVLILLACWLMVASLLFMRIGGYWENGVLTGYVAWPTSCSKVMMMGAVAILAVQVIYLLEGKPFRRLHDSRVVMLAGVCLSIFLALKVFSQDYVLILSHVVLNDLLLLTIMVFGVSSLAVIQLFYRPIVFAGWSTTWEILVRALALFSFASSCLATTLRYLLPNAVSAISTAALWAFLVASGLYLGQMFITVPRFSEPAEERGVCTANIQHAAF